MLFGSPFGFPFTESPPTVLLGDIWDVAVNGRPFRLDRKHEAFKQGFQSLPLLRQQSDDSAVPGEQSINREDLWRAGQSTWHKGAGQRWRDKEDSDAARFWKSKGVDVWSKDQLTLLKSTSLSLSSTASAPVIAPAGSFLYLGDGATIQRTNNGTSWTALPFASNTGSVTSVASNGFNVWALTPSMSYVSNTGLSTWSNWLTQPASGSWELVSYSRGRLLVTNQQFIYEVDGTNTATKLNPSEGNTAWKWTGITEGKNAIYAAGYSGHRSTIFKITPPSDDPSGALGVPVPAAPSLPNGELTQAIFGYLDKLVIGTNKGIRVAEQDDQGDLAIGALIETKSTVRCFEGDGQFIWFGWTNYDSASTGLGRLDLGQLTDTGVYAYASDLMYAGQGNVTTVASLNNKRYFGVAGIGIVGQGDTYVPVGTLESGYIRHGVVDDKTAQKVILRHDSLQGAVGISLASDDGEYNLLGASSLAGTLSPTVQFSAQDTSGGRFELAIALAGDAPYTSAPVVRHIELRSAITPSRGYSILVPMVLTENDAQFENRHPTEDYDALVALVNYKHSLVYQEKSKVMSAIAQDFQFERINETSDRRFWNGTFVLRLLIPAP